MTPQTGMSFAGLIALLVSAPVAACAQGDAAAVGTAAKAGPETPGTGSDGDGRASPVPVGRVVNNTVYGGN